MWKVFLMFLGTSVHWAFETRGEHQYIRQLIIVVKLDICLIHKKVVQQIPQPEYKKVKQLLSSNISLIGWRHALLPLENFFLPEFITPRRKIVFRQSHVVSGQIRQRVFPHYNYYATHKNQLMLHRNPVFCRHQISKKEFWVDPLPRKRGIKINYRPRIFVWSFIYFLPDVAYWGWNFWCHISVFFLSISLDAKAEKIAHFGRPCLWKNLSIDLFSSRLA